MATYTVTEYSNDGEIWVENNRDPGCRYKRTVEVTRVNLAAVDRCPPKSRVEKIVDESFPLAGPTDRASLVRLCNSVVTSVIEEAMKWCPEDYRAVMTPWGRMNLGVYLYKLLSTTEFSNGA
jgi:hypothetical protein